MSWKHIYHNEIKLTSSCGHKQSGITTHFLKSIHSNTIGMKGYETYVYYEWQYVIHLPSSQIEMSQAWEAGHEYHCPSMLPWMSSSLESCL